MKHLIPAFTSALTLALLVVACGPSPKPAPAKGPDPAIELSANDLAFLQDFHAWTLPVPESQQPLKRIKLVLVGPDGTSVPLFATAYSTPAPAWTDLLLGFRYESGRFVGRFHGLSPKGGGVTYDLSFTNASTKHPRSSTMTRTFWNSNRAELATFWNSTHTARTDSDDYATLALELLK
jgi:hypothetical protein